MLKLFGVELMEIKSHIYQLIVLGCIWKSFRYVFHADTCAHKLVRRPKQVLPLQLIWVSRTTIISRGYYV